MNKEKYKKAFPHVQPSRVITMEDLEMNKKSYVRGRIITVIGSIAGAVVLTGGVCYAANVGGIQDTVKLWLYGNQVEATVDMNEDGRYLVTYEDDNGKNQYHGYGEVLDEDGTWRPFTEEEIAEMISTEVRPRIGSDGRIMLYAKDTELDITDMFNVCETSIEVDGKTIWVRVEMDAEGGCAVLTSEAGPFVAVPENTYKEMFGIEEPKIDNAETMIVGEEN